MNCILTGTINETTTTTIMTESKPSSFLPSSKKVTSSNIPASNSIVAAPIFSQPLLLSSQSQQKRYIASQTLNGHNSLINYHSPYQRRVITIVPTIYNGTQFVTEIVLLYLLVQFHL